MDYNEFDRQMDIASGKFRTHPYYDFDHDGEVCLDGNFTLAQLELVVARMRELEAERK